MPFLDSSPCMDKYLMAITSSISVRSNQRGFSMRGVFNIIIGLVFIVGGLSGHLVMIGTQSGVALAALGAVNVGLGVFRAIKRGG